MDSRTLFERVNIRVHWISMYIVPAYISAKHNILAAADDCILADLVAGVLS